MKSRGRLPRNVRKNTTTGVRIFAMLRLLHSARTRTERLPDCGGLWLMRQRDALVLLDVGRRRLPWRLRAVIQNRV